TFMPSDPLAIIAESYRGIHESTLSGSFGEIMQGVTLTSGWMGKNRWSSVPSVWSGHALWYVDVRSLVRITVTTVGTLRVCVQTCDAKGLHECLHLQRDFVFSRTNGRSEDLSCAAITRMPQPS